MRRLFKRAVSVFLVPFTQWYLRKERSLRYKDISIIVLPGVFHPGFFYSTKFLLEYLEERDLKGKSVLELGCGSGLISIQSARRGSCVTATDINPEAIKSVIRNAATNNVAISVIESDLFQSIPKQTFDFIVINPPYYASDPINYAQYAWYCGKNFEYFQRLFNEISAYVDKSSLVIMVLTKGSDINSIKKIAVSQDITLELLREKNVLFDEKDYIFKLVIK